MKFLDNLPELDLLSKALSFSSPSLKVTTRVEAYSCKPISRERKLFKSLEQDLVSDIELSASISPPDQHEAQVGSAFGPLDKRNSRKTLWLLISTLNLAFPDFDFSSVHADEFKKETSARAVLASLSNALSHLRSSTTAPSTSVYRSFSSYTPATADQTGLSPDGELMHPPDAPTHPFLRQVLDPVIGLNECDVYSYAPDIESDPHAAESEAGSVAPSEAGGDTDSVMFDGSEEGVFPMDGFPGAPPTPSLPTVRKLRSGKQYTTASPFTPRPNILAELLTPRSRSNTPSVSEPEDSSGGLLWSCNYFFYNKQRKRILFISHALKKTDAPANGNSPLSSTPATFRPPSTMARPNAQENEAKRRANSCSIASAYVEDLHQMKRQRIIT